MHSALTPTSKSQLPSVTSPRSDDVISICSLTGTQHFQSKGKCLDVAAGDLNSCGNLIHLRDFLFLRPPYVFIPKEKIHSIRPLHEPLAGAIV